MAVSDGTPPGDAGAGDAGAPPAPQAPAAQTPAAARPSPSTPAANGGAEDVLRTFVRSSVEKILKEAPWTFHKVNPLKEACRRFLREVDEEVAVEPKARGGVPAAHLSGRAGGGCYASPACSDLAPARTSTCASRSSTAKGLNSTWASWKTRSPRTSPV